MRVVVGKDYHDFRLLTESDKTLKSEGLYKSAKVCFVIKLSTHVFATILCYTEAISLQKVGQICLK